MLKEDFESVKLKMAEIGSGKLSQWNCDDT